MTTRASAERLRLDTVGKSFGQDKEKTLVLEGVSLRVMQGEFVSVFGPNGCGKTTLLNLIAGILTADSGSVIHKADRSGRVGMVFQDYDKTLFPWKNCLGNIALALEAESNLPRGQRGERAKVVLDELGLNLPPENFPYEMSGGQKQLTSLARAMVAQPSLLLLDEPFASLDYETRINMQTTLQDIWLKTGVTTILVSHEIDEALFLADRLLLLTPMPARVAEEYKIPFERPRTLDSISSPEFVELRHSILRQFHGLVTA